MPAIRTPEPINKGPMFCKLMSGEDNDVALYQVITANTPNTIGNMTPMPRIGWCVCELRSFGTSTI